MGKNNILIEELNTHELNLNKKSVSGGIWNILGGGWNTFLKLGSSTIFARILLPEDFGVLASAFLIFGLFSQLSVLGAGAGVIAMKNVTKDDLSTAFWLNFIVQMLLFLVFLSLAPNIASFFDMPALTSIIRIMSLRFVLGAISGLHNTILNKLLKFKTLVIISGLGVFIEVFISIILITLYKYGIWGLIYGMIASEIFMALLRLKFVRWVPGIVISINSLKYLSKYGLNLLGESITIYLRQNIDYLVIAKLLDSSTLGYYSFAYRIPNLITEKIAGPIAAMSLPIFSKTQNDKELMINYFEMIKYIMLLTYPLLGVLFISSFGIVSVLWGENWLTIINPMKILVLASVISCLALPIGAVFLCKNKPEFLFKIGIIKLVLGFVMVGCLGYFFGLIGVATGMVISTLPYFYQLYYAFQITDLSIKDYYEYIEPPLETAILALFMCGIVSVFISMVLSSEIIISILNGFVFLISFIVVLNLKFQTEYMKIINIIRMKNK